MMWAALALAAITPPGVVIDHEPAASRQFIGSPSIVRCRWRGMTGGCGGAWNGARRGVGGILKR
jgi:hypothetical protein